MKQIALILCFLPVSMFAQRQHTNWDTLSDFRQNIIISDSIYFEGMKDSLTEFAKADLEGLILFCKNHKNYKILVAKIKNMENEESYARKMIGVMNYFYGKLPRTAIWSDMRADKESLKIPELQNDSIVFRVLSIN